MREPRWAVVVPVKRLAVAKTRLRGAVLGVPHERLVLALVQDTVRAVLACPVVAQVLVVTDDPHARAALRLVGAAATVPAGRLEFEADVPGSGLNAAFTHGAARAARSGRWLAAIAADLPALRPGELTAALTAAANPTGGRRRSFIPDAYGTGTTLLTAPPGVPLDPAFGIDSAAAHAASGAHRLDGEWPSLRRDVDTAADLCRAALLGLGPHTTAVCVPRVHCAAPPA